MKYKRNYLYVTGGKGGIGKSTFTLFLIDYFSLSGNVLLIDCDKINPDFSTVYTDGKYESIRSIRTSRCNPDE